MQASMEDWNGQISLVVRMISYKLKKYIVEETL